MNGEKVRVKVHRLTGNMNKLVSHIVWLIAMGIVHIYLRCAQPIWSTAADFMSLDFPKWNKKKN